MTRRRETSETRRREILQAAAQVICERGWAETRITDVAERAGASPALVIHYFDTRDRLLADALTFAEERFVQASQRIEEIGDARAQLSWMLSALFDLSEDTGQLVAWTLWLDLWARSRHDGDLAQRRQALDAQWRQTVADLVR